MLIATVTTAKSDIYGNRYSFITLVNSKNNKITELKTGWGDSDNEILEIERFFNHDHKRFVISKVENVPIRKFSQLEKDLKICYSIKKELNKLGFRSNSK